MQDINVEEIMDGIRAEVASGAASPADAGEQPVPGEVEGNAAYQLQKETYEVFDYLNQKYEIEDYFDMGSGVKGSMKKGIQKAVRMNTVPIVQQQTAFNANVVHGMNLMRDQITRQRDELLTETMAVRVENQDLCKIIGDLQSRMAQQEKTLENCMTQLSQLATKVKKLENAQASGVNPVAQSIAGAVSTVAAAVTSATAPAQAVPVEEDAYADLDYFKFQNEFRGSAEAIMERQRIYEPYFQNAPGKVFDFGCGRGEFLQLMKECGVEAFGVDSYEEYVALGEMKGLDIRQGDAVEFMKETDELFGGIFVGQVVEHIGFPNIVRLCKLAYEKLAEGGYLVMETPNAACLGIYTNSFYLDPTHKTPVHPLLLQYVAREAGFSEVEIVYTEGSRSDISIPPIISDSIENLEEVNNALHCVSETMFGSMDYAIVARK